MSLGRRDSIELARIVPPLDSTPSAEGSPSKRSKKRSSVPSPEVYTYKEKISSDINISLAKKRKYHGDISDIVADEVENQLVESILARDKEEERRTKKAERRAKKEAKRAKKALIVNDK